MFLKFGSLEAENFSRLLTKFCPLRRGRFLPHILVMNYLRSWSLQCGPLLRIQIQQCVVLWHTLALSLRPGVITP